MKRENVIEVNGRAYARKAETSLAVICLDGTGLDYLEAAAASGRAPFLAELLRRGHCLEVRSAMPSLTNPNNLSIVCGAPPAVHGICGNYFLEPQSGAAVMMNDAAFLRAGTIPAAFARAGARVAVVTAKDKLRRLLGAGLPTGDTACCLSVESAFAGADFLPELAEICGGRPPEVYSAEVSALVLQAGAVLLERFRPELLYLSTTDYIQHKYAPGTAEANALFTLFDPWLARLDELGARLVITADHGMSAKTDPAGNINCVYLGTFLAGVAALSGPDRSNWRVILPITDPYTAHHGALGAYAGIHLPESVVADRPLMDELVASLRALPGVELVLERAEACARFELPPDRTADLVVLSDQNTVLGLTPAEHDLGGLDRPLRSHGGLGESRVPLLANRKFSATNGIGHNYDASHAGLNCLE